MQCTHGCRCTGQSCPVASLLEKEDGNVLGARFLLSSPFICSLDCGRAPFQRKGDALTEAGPYQKCREGRVSWQLPQLSFSTLGTGCPHGLSEPWP